MKHLKRYYVVFLIPVLATLLLHNAGCQRELSMEGFPYDSIPVPDSIPQDTTDTIAVIPAATLPPCNLCNEADSIQTGQWSFKTGNSYACGSFTNAGFIGGNAKTDFTFFGPSACSIDTGIVVTVYLPVALDQDRSHLTSDYASFYYYNHNDVKDIFMSRQEAPFTVTVDSFDFETGVVTGTFSGTVFTANGDSAYISNGRYKAALH